MKPVRKFTSPRRDVPSNGPVYHDGTRGKTMELKKHSLSTSDEPIPFQRSWRKPVTSSESTGQSVQSLRHAGAIPKRREKNRVSDNTHQFQGNGNSSSPKQVQHARRRIPGISNRREESSQNIVKAKSTNEKNILESAKSNNQSHSSVKKITRKYFRQHKANRDGKARQPESQDDGPNNVKKVQRLQVDSFEGVEKHCDEVQSSSTPVLLQDGSSTGKLIRTEPPALRDAAVNSVDGEESNNLAESNHQPHHRNNFNTQIGERFREEGNKESSNTSESSQNLIDEHLPSSASNERIPNSSIRSLRRSPRAPRGSCESTDTSEHNREQGAGTLDGNLRRSASSLSNSLETFTSSNMISSPESGSTLSTALPTLADLRQRNLPNLRSSSRSNTPVHQQGYERFQVDLGRRLRTETPSLFGTRGEADLESSSDQLEQETFNFDHRFQTPEFRRNPSSSLDRSRGLNSSRNLSTFTSTSNRGSHNMNASLFSEQSPMSDTSEDREPVRMRNASPLETEQPTRLLSRQTERESYAFFRNRQIQRDRERVRHRLVNPSSFNQDELFLLSSDSPRPSVNRTAGTRLPSLSTLSHDEDTLDQSPLGGSLSGAAHPVETPPPSPTPGSFRSRDDRERVANHLAVMACPLFAPLLFELPPAIMIQMLASARQELGDEFVQLLIENVVLSLLAQQMHDAGLTSDAGDSNTNRPPPATKEVIQSLTKKEISAEMKEKECKCAICHVEYESEETVTELGCGHFFHGACISIWLDKTATCPVCRYHLQEH